jgi:hypothetical protein
VITFPKQTPSAGMLGAPMLRAEKSSWRWNDSTSTGPSGVKPYFAARSFQAASSRGARYGVMIAASSGCWRITNGPVFVSTKVSRISSAWRKFSRTTSFQPFEAFVAASNAAFASASRPRFMRFTACVT